MSRNLSPERTKFSLGFKNKKKKKKKKKIEYIQAQINKIRNSVEGRQKRLKWQKVNEMNERKSTSRGKLKSTSQEERLLKWKKHFKNQLGNSP